VLIIQFTAYKTYLGRTYVKQETITCTISSLNPLRMCECYIDKMACRTGIG